jgi:hypothetical protein
MFNRTWDYLTEGVAHYGLSADFLRDIQLRVNLQRDETSDQNLMFSAEYFGATNKVVR